MPASTPQLGTYALGMEEQFGFRPMYGQYFMARKGENSQLFSMNMYTKDLLSDWYSKAAATIEQELFIPHVTSMCATCSVAKHCYAVGGIPPKPVQFRSIAS